MLGYRSNKVVKLNTPANMISVRSWKKGIGFDKNAT